MADDLDALLAARAGAQQPDPLDAMLAKRAQGGTIPAGPAAPGTGNPWLDGGNAVGTGFWRGLAGLAGLPVDTVANVIDLGKAGVGSAYTAATGKAPPDALQVGDRSDVVGSGAWLRRKAESTAPGRLMIDPANPDYEGGYLQNSGAALTGIVNPNSRLELAKQLVLSQTAATAAKAVKDNGGSDALAITASLLPQGAVHYGAEGAKRGMTGDSLLGSTTPGRTAMQQRMQTLADAGVTNPTMGLATGSNFVGGVENILANTPGAVGVMSRARTAAVTGMQNTAQEAAELASANRGALESGVAIRKGIQSFKDAYKDKQGQLYDNLDRYIDPSAPTSVGNTQSTLSALNANITGAPNVSAFFKNQKIKALADAITKDTAGSPQSVMVYSRPPVAGGGLMNAPIPQQPTQVVVPPGPPTGTLPWEAVKKTRTMVGNEIADNTIASDVPNSKWRPLYGALSQDMSNAANQAGPQATQAFGRASAYTRAGADRLERVAPFAQTTAPEQAFTQAVNATRENVSTLQALKKTLPQDARGTIAGTVIERLGRANNGVQNAEGTAWSPETFLTNWNKMTPKARDELFSGFQNSGDVKASVDAVARTASMMRDNSKLWANPSGTAASWGARGALGAVGVGGGAAYAGLLNPLIPAAVAAGMGGANVLARALTNKEIVGSIAQPTRLTPNDVQSLVRMLQATGTTSP